MHTVFFIDSINENTCKGLMKECTNAIAGGATRIQIRMSSTGGSIHAGFWLANVLQSLPIDVATHNIGEVSSMAIPVFLAAPVRSADPNSRFVVHPLTWTVTAPTEIPHHKLREWVDRLDNDVERYVAVFEQATRTAQERFDIRAALAGNAPTVMDVVSARRAGVVSNVASSPLSADNPGASNAPASLD